MSSAETSSETSSQTNTEAELTPVPFEQVCPILRVRDVSASIDYYFASVSRGKSNVKGIRDKPAPGFGSASKTRMLVTGIPPQRSENSARSHKLPLGLRDAGRRS